MLIHLSNLGNDRYIPAGIRRILRQEVNFGCAICGCPVIIIHHIIPWAQTHKHNPKDMIALCPTCAHRADNNEYTDEYLREMKKSPHNTTTVEDAFTVQTQELSVSLAGNIFTNIPRILVVDDFDIISLSKDGEFPKINVNFFDKLNRWIGIIYENEWVVDTKYVWDVEYR